MQTTHPRSTHIVYHILSVYVATMLIWSWLITLIPLPPIVLEIPLTIAVIASGIVLNTANPIPRTRTAWQIGFGLWFITWLMTLFNHETAALLRTTIAYPVLTMPVMLWLAARFSTTLREWFPIAVRNTTIYTGISGTLFCLSHLTGIHWLGQFTAYANPVLMIVTATHLYKPLSERNEAKTLAGHWVALGILLYLIAVGIPGALLVYPNNFDTRVLLELTQFLLQIGTASVMLGVVNQVAVELRGINRRVTGLLPYWYFSGGVFGYFLAMYAVGIAAMIGDTVDLQPIFLSLAHRAQQSIAIGMTIYALAFFIRRVRNKTNLVKSNTSS